MFSRKTISKRSSSHPLFHSIKTREATNEKKKKKKLEKKRSHSSIRFPSMLREHNKRQLHTVNVETWPAATTGGKLVKIPLCRKHRPRFHRRCPRVNTEGKTQLKAVKLYRRKVRFERVGEEKEIKGEWDGGVRRERGGENRLQTLSREQGDKSWSGSHGLYVSHHLNGWFYADQRYTNP